MASQSGEVHPFPRPTQSRTLCCTVHNRQHCIYFWNGAICKDKRSSWGMSTYCAKSTLTHRGIWPMRIEICMLCAHFTPWSYGITVRTCTAKLTVYKQTPHKNRTSYYTICPCPQPFLEGQLSFYCPSANKATTNVRNTTALPKRNNTRAWTYLGITFRIYLVI